MTEVHTNGDTNGETSLVEESEEMEEIMDTQSIPVKTDVIGDGEEPMNINNDVPYDDHKLFVGGLTSDTTEQTLKDYFEEYGTINEIILKVDPMTGRSRGFAFLLFKENDAVDKILEASPHTIGDKVVDTKKAIPHAVHQQMKQRTKKVFVGGVPTDMPEHTIKEHFEKFGPIEEVALVTEKGTGTNKKRRGFCFVTFLSEDTAEKACCNSFHKINESDVEVKRATPREQDKRMPHGNTAPPFVGRGGRGHIMQAQSGRGGHWAPYGGHAGYFNYFPPPHYGGSYMGGAYGAYGGYGGYGGGYDPYTGGRRDEVAYNSRYGPMRSNYAHNNHSHHVHSHHHPYSR